MALVPFTACKFISGTQFTTLVLEQIHYICVDEKKFFNKKLFQKRKVRSFVVFGSFQSLIGGILNGCPFVFFFFEMISYATSVIPYHQLI